MPDPSLLHALYAKYTPSSAARALSPSASQSDQNCPSFVVPTDFPVTSVHHHAAAERALSRPFHRQEEEEGQQGLQSGRPRGQAG
jgi:hypothetical protein